MAGWSAHSVCSAEQLRAARSKGLSDNKGVQAETLYHRDDAHSYTLPM